MPGDAVGLGDVFVLEYGEVFGHVGGEFSGKHFRKHHPFDLAFAGVFQLSGKGAGFEKEYKILRLLYRIVPLNVSAVLQVGNDQPGFFLNFPDDGSNNRFPRLNMSAGESQSRPRIRRLWQSFLYQHPSLRISNHTHITKFSFHFNSQVCMVSHVIETFFETSQHSFYILAIIYRLFSSSFWHN